MKSHKLLVFDISSEYGHFRKFNTTSSPLTYAIPTRSALAGVLGAILGVEREASDGTFPDGVIPVNELFAAGNADIGIQILNPIKKTNIGFNLLDTGKAASSFFNIKNRTQIEFELLKDAKFRIFLHLKEDKIAEELAERIEAVNHHFTPYLGLSQFTAIVEWQGQVEATLEVSDSEYIAICTSINLSKLEEKRPIKFEQASYTTDTMPMGMRRDRVITEYAEVLIERTGKKVLVNTPNYWKTSFGNILYL